jgi:hypothetical protein
MHACKTLWIIASYDTIHHIMLDNGHGLTIILVDSMVKEIYFYVSNWIQ